MQTKLIYDDNNKQHFLHICTCYMETAWLFEGWSNVFCIPRIKILSLSLKWPGYRRVFCFETQVANTSYIKEMGYRPHRHTGGRIKCRGRVSIPYRPAEPRGTQGPLVENQCISIGYTEETAVKSSGFNLVNRIPQSKPVFRLCWRKIHSIVDIRLKRTPGNTKSGIRCLWQSNY
jgi:hypothetical protein